MRCVDRSQMENVVKTLSIPTLSACGINLILIICMIYDCNTEDVDLMNMFICCRTCWLILWIIASVFYKYFSHNDKKQHFHHWANNLIPFRIPHEFTFSTKICILNMKFIFIGAMWRKASTNNIKVQRTQVFRISAVDRYALCVVVLTIDRREGQYHDIDIYIYINNKILLIGKFSPVRIHLYLIMPTVRCV